MIRIQLRIVCTEPLGATSSHVVQGLLHDHGRTHEPEASGDLLLLGERRVEGGVGRAHRIVRSLLQRDGPPPRVRLAQRPGRCHFRMIGEELPYRRIALRGGAVTDLAQLGREGHARRGRIPGRNGRRVQRRNEHHGQQPDAKQRQRIRGRASSQGIDRHRRREPEQSVGQHDREPQTQAGHGTGRRDVHTDRQHDRTQQDRGEGDHQCDPNRQLGQQDDSGLCGL